MDGNPLDSFASLTVTGNAEFDGEVGQIDSLYTLSVSGATDVNTDKITTFGLQTYTGAGTLARRDTRGLDDNVQLLARRRARADHHRQRGLQQRQHGQHRQPLGQRHESFDGSLTTSGSQTYSGAVTLATDETLISTGGNVTFGSTVDGAHELSVNAASGTVTFGDFVGGGTPLSVADR